MTYLTVMVLGVHPVTMAKVMYESSCDNHLFRGCTLKPGDKTLVEEQQ